VKLFSKNSNLYEHDVNVTDGQTDGRTENMASQYCGCSVYTQLRILR